MKDKKEAVYNKIEGYRDEIINFTKQLVEIPTINPPGKNYSKIVDVLEKKFQTIGMKTKRYVVPKDEMKKNKKDPSYPRISLIAKLDNKKNKTIHFNGHYDVVPANKEWKEAFVPKVKGDRLYGRGGYDMKHGFACYFYAIKALIDCKIYPNVNIEVSCVPDEETGGKLGMGYLAKKGIIKAEYGIGEGAMKKMFSIGNKGVMFIEIEVIGKSSHGAYPYLGVNSFEKMNLLVNDLMTLKKQVEKRKTKYPTENENDKYATFVIGGMVKGGDKANTVPQKTSFSIDRRVLPEEGVEKAKKEIKEVVDKFRKKHNDVKVILNFKQSNAPVIVEPNSFFAKRFLESANEVVGDLNPKFTSGGTDMRYLIRKGIPSLGYNATGSNMHADHEWVSIKSMVNTTKVFANLIMNLEK